MLSSDSPLSSNRIVQFLAFGSATYGASLLLYRVCVRWNSYKLMKYEEKVSNDASKLLSSLDECSSNDHSDTDPKENHAKSKISPFSEAIVGKKRCFHFKNRIIKAATYEALCDKNGVPLPELSKFHERMVQGGCGMSIVAYGGANSNCDTI